MSHFSQRTREMGHPAVGLSPLGSPLLLDKLLELVDDTGPAAAVILAGGREIGESAVRDFHARAAGDRGQFPADDGALRFVLVPVGDPRIGEDAGRIIFKHFSVAINLLTPFTFIVLDL